MKQRQIYQYIIIIHTHTPTRIHTLLRAHNLTISACAFKASEKNCSTRLQPFVENVDVPALVKSTDIVQNILKKVVTEVKRLIVWKLSSKWSQCKVCFKSSKEWNLCDRCQRSIEEVNMKNIPFLSSFENSIKIQFSTIRSWDLRFV